MTIYHQKRPAVGISIFELRRFTHANKGKLKSELDSDRGYFNFCANWKSCWHSDEFMLSASEIILLDMFTRSRLSVWSYLFLILSFFRI